MAKPVAFTREAAQRVAAAVRRVEGGAGAAGAGWHAYRGDDAETRFFRLQKPLANCGGSRAVAVRLKSASSSCPEFVDTREKAVEVRDIGNIVRTYRFAMDEPPDQPLGLGTIVECDFRKPSTKAEKGFWRIVRVIDCDCSSTSSSSSSASSSSASSSSWSSASSSSASSASSSSASSSDSSSASSASSSSHPSSSSWSASSSSSHSSSSSWSSSSDSSSGSGSSGSGSSGSSGSGGSGSSSGSGGSGSGDSSGSGSGDPDPCATVDPKTLPRVAPVVRIVNGRASVEGVTLFGFDAGGDLVRVDVGDLVAAVVEAMKANP